eukprot:765653-Hanusia_phi.AAC.6
MSVSDDSARPGALTDKRQLSATVCLFISRASGRPGAADRARDRIMIEPSDQSRDWHWSPASRSLGALALQQAGRLRVYFY